VVRLAGDVLHDAVPVTLLVGESDQDMEDGRRKREQIFKSWGLAH
jgi:hypothetical protein